MTSPQLCVRSERCLTSTSWDFFPWSWLNSLVSLRHRSLLSQRLGGRLFQPEVPSAQLPPGFFAAQILASSIFSTQMKGSVYVSIPVLWHGNDSQLEQPKDLPVSFSQISGCLPWWESKASLRSQSRAGTGRSAVCLESLTATTSEKCHTSAIDEYRNLRESRAASEAA